MSLLAGLFPPFVAEATGDPRAVWPLAWSEEEQAVRGAIPARRNEFRAGRGLGRQAMDRLNSAAAPILHAPDRSPSWPDGLVGSISHCADLCVAVVGLAADQIAAIGVDIEPAEPLDDSLIGDICTSTEQVWLAGLPPVKRGVYARLIFSAKECAYKCQYPMSRSLFDFTDIDIVIDGAGGFSARFNIDVTPFRQGIVLRGHYRITDSHIATGMTLFSHDLAALNLSANCPDLLELAHA